MELPRNITDKPIIKNRLMDLYSQIIQIFGAEPATLKITGPTMIIGDIHGNLHALNLIIEQWKESGCKNILLLGDYIDKGSQGAECLLMLFDLKIADPTHIFLLRGNHEDEHMNRFYGFYDEIGFDNGFLISMHHIFQTMPIAAILDDKIFCTHGGITKDSSIKSITKSNSYQYLWNDPCDKPGIIDSYRGENIKMFGEDIAEAFMAANGFTHIIRSHEFQKGGYKWYFGGKLLSIFSSTNYLGKKSRAAFGIYRAGKIELYSFDNEKNIEKCE